MRFQAGFKGGDRVRSANVWWERVPKVTADQLKALDPIWWLSWQMGQRAGWQRRIGEFEKVCRCE